MSLRILIGVLCWCLCHHSSAQALDAQAHEGSVLRNGNDHNVQELDTPATSHIIAEAQSSHVEVDALVLAKRAVQEVQVQGNDIGTPQDAAGGSTTIWQYPNRFLISKNAEPGVGLPSPYGDVDTSSGTDRDGAARKRAMTAGKESQELSPRQDSSITTKQIYISANTCSQPHWIGTGVQDVAPPQLTLYVSTTSMNQKLGPDGDSNAQTMHPFVDGFVNASVSASGDWYMAVYAPTYSSEFAGQWNYELAVSINGYFYSAHQEATSDFLHLVDTDMDAALLISGRLGDQNATNSNLYNQWMKLKPPFVMFAMNENVTSYMGLESSFCGLRNAVKSAGQVQALPSDLGGTTTNVQMQMSSRGVGNYPRQQFYVTKLNSSSTYRGYIAMQGNSTATGNGVVGGGGTVWPYIRFTTKTDGNCQLMFDLPFCDGVAYAVPANPQSQNATLATFDGLKQFYDNYTSFWYQNFANSLQVLACNTTSNAQYSLAKNCGDCAAAYKEWLCAVSIPRCEDFSNPAEHLQIRNVGQPFYNNNSMLEDNFLQQNYVPMQGAPTVQGTIGFQQTLISSFATNQSRNPAIDQYIAPGPYKEVKPCEDLCFSLMQSCPAALGFSCPYRGRGLDVSYGKRGAPGTVECSYIGAYYHQSAGERLMPGVEALMWALTAVTICLMVQ
jgi:calcium channel MID1